MRIILGVLGLLVFISGTLAEATNPEDDSGKFGTGHVALLQNISDSLDASMSDKRNQHKQILKASNEQHEEIKKERDRLHKELKEDRARQFQVILEEGDKHHSEFVVLLQQIMKNIESTDAYKLGKIHMDLIEKINKALAASKNENAQHLNELKTTFEKQHNEIKNLKTQQAEEIKKERNAQFETIKKKRLQQEMEIKKMLQQVVAKFDQPQNCYELYQMGIKTDGVYLIKPQGINENVFVSCDMTKDNGGWTGVNESVDVRIARYARFLEAPMASFHIVAYPMFAFEVIQRRGNFGPVVEFRQAWEAYKNGFGKLTGEHWLGNNIIYHLVKSQKFQLKIDMKDYKNVSSYITFPKFYIDPESNHYALRLGGTAVGQPATTMTTSNGLYFSTTDRVNNCRTYNQYGPWWLHSDCRQSANLNGVRHNSPGMYYITFDGNTPLAEVTMKVKPANS